MASPAIKRATQRAIRAALSKDRMTTPGDLDTVRKYVEKSPTVAHRAAVLTHLRTLAPGS